MYKTSNDNNKKMILGTFFSNTSHQMRYLWKKVEKFSLTILLYTTVKI